MTREEIEELYEERAAIMEHDGGLPRETAEALARQEMEAHWAAIEAAEGTQCQSE